MNETNQTNQINKDQINSKEEENDIDSSEYYWDKPILITGVPRSGTSMVSGLCHISGVWKGKTIGPSKENPKGFFENASLRESVLKPYLRSIKADPLGQDPLPLLSDCAIDQNIKNRIKRVLLDEGYHRGPWLWKDAKLLLTFPLWVALYPDAKWIIVRRNQDAIAESCMKTGFMRARRTFKEWQSWVEDYESRISYLKENAINWVELDANLIIKDGSDYLKMFVDYIGLPNFDKERANNFISRQFWHH